MQSERRGRLRPPSAAPLRGEEVVALARLGEVRVEQILSGDLGAPVAYSEEDDEWVVLLQGGARLEIGGEVLELGVGDWLVIPARTPHQLLSTDPATSWLAIRSPGDRP